MMHRILLLLICLAFFSRIFSQSLEGEWIGWYNYKDSPKDTVILKLQFQLNKDSTYSVYSFCRFKHESLGGIKYARVVCKMSYKMLNRRSVYLEEVELISAENYSREILFQKTTLELDYNFRSMKGTWGNVDEKATSSGSVWFTKKI